jgi:hypothetical protein
MRAEPARHNAQRASTPFPRERRPRAPTHFQFHPLHPAFPTPGNVIPTAKDNNSETFARHKRGAGGRRISIVTESLARPEFSICTFPTETPARQAFRTPGNAIPKRAPGIPPPVPSIPTRSELYFHARTKHPDQRECCSAARADHAVAQAGHSSRHGMPFAHTDQTHAPAATSIGGHVNPSRHRALPPRTEKSERLMNESLIFY